MNKTKSETDWKRVLAFKEGDVIPYEPEDGPYDPNDDEAVDRFLTEANRVSPAMQADNLPIRRAS